MDSRIVIFSDTHLGAPGRGAGSPDALRPLWQGATKVIVNGDTAELADPSWRVAAARAVMRIQELCEQDGVELELLSGNHDPMIDDRRFLRLCGNQVFVTHGDMLHPAISPWNSYAPQLQALHERALASLGPIEQLDLSARLAAVQHSSCMKWDDVAAHNHKVSRLEKLIELPFKAMRVFWYWMTMPQRAARFATQHAPQSRFFVFGHYHRTGIWNIGGRTIINTGCFGGLMLPSAVVIEGLVLRIVPIRRCGETFCLASRDKATFDLGS
jgi:predicted phosphodiesterase